ncbi:MULTISPECIES: hypothetical protein [Streptomyces]|uniref:Uncharacterized protein n=1 Tax=Streptomyces cacaoi TaxID=1898 RepID=A0A4Y3QVK9_STRCI|nr:MULTISPECIES: hypothetical protein [Streptomyces]GEB49281.1 hypothetical protein SCA03_18320 [Streptomyces cacaoi]
MAEGTALRPAHALGAAATAGAPPAAQRQDTTDPTGTEDAR